MFTEKLNLYNAEWLELVFSNRNKSYGAYELRRHYGRTMFKAMAIAFIAVIGASIMYTFAKAHVKNIEPTLIRDSFIVVDITRVKPPVAPAKPVEPAAPSKPEPAAPSIKYNTPHVVPGEVNSDPPTIAELNNVEIGPVTSKGDGGQVQAIEDPGTAGMGGTGVEQPVDNTEYRSVEVMPEPDGGLAGWTKFLNKNLRFPAQAQDAGVGGRVIVSFVVEKDGHLTDIVVTGKAGYGMDEEAIRVLKLAKPWKPGYQNGKAVRVRYSIPMNFQLSE